MEIVERLSPHRDSRDGHPVRLVVVHGDAGETDEGTLSWMEHPESKVSYHWFVGRDGTVYLVVPEEERAWHAGKSDWLGATVGSSVNHTSVGVCLANSGPGDPPEEYRDIQYQRAGELIARIMARYGITLDKIRGHFEVSPKRKTDPWDHHDWRTLYGWIGMYAAGRVGDGPSAPPRDSPTLQLGSEGMHVEWLQRLLREHEPSIQPDGVYGKRTEDAVRSYQAGQGLTVDGIAGPETWARLLFEEEG